MGNNILQPPANLTSQDSCQRFCLFYSISCITDSKISQSQMANVSQRPPYCPNVNNFICYKLTKEDSNQKSKNKQIQSLHENFIMQTRTLQMSNMNLANSFKLTRRLIKIIMHDNMNHVTASPHKSKRKLVCRTLVTSLQIFLKTRWFSNYLWKLIIHTCI